MTDKNLKKYVVHVPREGNMLKDAYIYTSRKLKLEESAVQQLKNAARIPGIVHVVATPDIHLGYGVPIGSVLGTIGTVIPAAVGYDINCGMRMITTGINRNDFPLERLAYSLRKRIPLGEGKKNVNLKRDDFITVAEGGIRGLASIKRSGSLVLELVDDDDLKEQYKRVEDSGALKGNIDAVSSLAVERGRTQLATLGGGNHFIEIQYIEQVFDNILAERFGLIEGEITIMIHTGSRGFGHQVGGDYMKIANKRTSEKAPELAKLQIGFLDASEREGRNYIDAMNCAANFAYVNRYLLYLVVRNALKEIIRDAEPFLLYDVPHNILKMEEHFGRNLFVHRKGATRAFGKKRMSGTIFSKTGQPVLIPGSMGTASYVLSGVDDNQDTICSVNHGAGRVMSRTEARGKVKKGKVVRPAAITDDEFKRSMKGIILHAENMRTIKEEAPQAYKDIDEVINVVTGAGLSKKIARVKPLAVLKG